MILEYHKIDNPEARWTRTPENFRRDLIRLWERGYRTVALTDYLDGKIALPAGTTPVVFTFDDSSPGQFRYVQKGNDWVIDPDCAIGILEAFEREHPGFGHAATFYVLPGAKPPNRPLQPEGPRGPQAPVPGEPRLRDRQPHALARRARRATRRPSSASSSRPPRSGSSGTCPVIGSVPWPCRMGGYPKELAWAVSGEAKGMTYATTPS